MDKVLINVIGVFTWMKALRISKYKKMTMEAIIFFTFGGCLDNNIVFGNKKIKKNMIVLIFEPFVYRNNSLLSNGLI